MTAIQTLPDLEDIWQQTLAWQPNQQQQQWFQQLYAAIIQENRHLNLTRITEPIAFWEKHLWDSLAGLQGLGIAEELAKARSLKIIDIGTGAGFPGIPVAIALPASTVTLLDSTRKKINFINLLLSELKLTNVQTLIGRAEEVGRQKLHRESYDIALIRAVGEASICAKYALPLVKVGGLAILYRGHWSDEESFTLEKAVAQLGGKIESIQELITPISQSLRHCLYVHKLASTASQFPRLVGR